VILSFLDPNLKKMKSSPQTKEQLQQEIEVLRQNLDEAQALLKTLGKCEVVTPAGSDIADKKIKLLSQKVAELSESEEEFRLMADAAPVLLWQSGTDTLCYYFNKPWLDFTGRTLEQEIGNGWAEGVHPADFQGCLDVYLNSFNAHKSFKMEYRLRNAKGEYRWIVDNGAPRFAHDRTFLGYIGSCVDITDMKSAKQELQSQYTLLSSIINSPGKIAIFSLDKNYCYTSFNEIHAHEMKRVWNKDIEIGQNQLNYIKNPEVAAHAKHSIDRALKGEHFTETHIRPENNVYYEFSWNPILLGGEIIGVTAFVQDIAEREQAAEALRNANTYNRRLIEASIDPLVTIGPDGKINDVNKATEEVTGIPRVGLIGTDFSDYFTEPQQARNGYLQVLSKGFVRDYPLTIRHTNGKTTDVLYNASVYENAEGKVAGVFAAAHDITIRKQAEEGLRNANAYNRRLIEASIDPLVTIGPDGKITDVNKATEAVTGMLRESLIGSDFSDYFTEPQQARNGYLKALADGQVRDYPLTIRHANGHTTDVVYNASVYENAEGKTAGVFAAARDITEQKQAEEKIKKSQLLLQSSVESQKDTAIFFFDREYRYLHFNKAHRDSMISAYKVTIEPGMNILDCITSKRDRSVAKLNFDRTLKGESHSNIQKFGDAHHPIYFESFFNPIWNENNEIIGATSMSRNITDRIIAEKTKQDALDRLTKIASRVPGVVYQYRLHADGNSCFPYASEGIQSIYRVSPEEVMRDASKVFSVIHPDDLEAVAASIQESAQKLAPWKHEYRTKYSDGTIRTLLGDATPQKEEDGSILWHGYITDITERKKAEEALRESEERFKTMFMQAPMGIALIDSLSGHIYEVNPRFAEIAGRTVEEMATINWMKITHPDDVQADVDKMVQMNEGKINGFQLVKRYLHPDRTVVWINMTVVPIKSVSNDHPRHLCMIEDITQRRKAEETLKKHTQELEKSEKRYSDLFNLSPQPMWLYNPRTLKFVHANKAAIKQYGYTETEFLNMRIMDIMTEDQIVKTRELIMKDKMEPDSPDGFSRSSRHHKKNGEIIDVEIYNSPIVINETMLRSVIAIDVTERKQYEYNITKAIIKAQEDERYEIGGELHNNVCQILAACQMSLGMLKDAIPAAKTPYYNQCNDYIKMASDDIRNLSNDLAPAFLKDSNLPEAFGRMLNSFNTDHQYETQLQCSENVKSYPLSFELQQNLYRILQEQLKNIAHHAHASSIEIDVTIENNMLGMLIGDNGYGFVIKDAIDGIGFTNIKRRVELYSGKIDIDSSPGNGCKISIMIPLRNDTLRK